MCRRSAAVAVLLLVLNLSVVSLFGGPEPASAPDKTVLEHFPIAENAHFLIVPVEIKGKRYQFALDTGATSTIYDTSLRHLLGEPVQVRKVQTPSGVTTLPLFQPPDAKVGKLPFPKDCPIIAANLERIRQVSGEEIYGMIGMDFLGKYILRIDFDSGEVVFLRSIGPNPGDRIPLFMHSGPPQVQIRIAGQDSPDCFVLDTGMSGHGSGGMSAELFDALIRKKKMSSVVKQQQVVLSGTLGQRQGRVEAISFANHRHERLLFSQSQVSVLGLRFCSRYVMTCDFPNRSLYVKRGRRFDRPDKRNLSGLHILRVKGETQVSTVDEGSPAAAAGVQSHDILLMVNGKKVGDIPLPVLRERFCSEGERIRLLVRRDTEQRKVSFFLPKAD
jgi:hypothetical protein